MLFKLKNMIFKKFILKSIVFKVAKLLPNTFNTGER